MTTFQIRSARFSDLEILNTLMFELHDYHHKKQPKHIKTANDIEKEKSIALYLDNPECLVYVATEHDVIIGFITGHFCELSSVISKPISMGSIDELYIIPEKRHLKVASQLMNKIELMFEDLGVKRVFVEVWQFNQSALSLYKKNGFSHHIHWLCKELPS